MTTMMQDKGADYCDRWATQIATRLGTTPEFVLRMVRRVAGTDTVGDLTPAQAKAVVSEVHVWTEMPSYDAQQARADDLHGEIHD